ncbi:MAG: hypothetical protein RMM29_06370 [Planctomycetota bacterium]|nr:hypothetical protein [Planctomycetota bacterium]MCX8039719.1 hypothetical protein [Planctomycetota bacterium]MDW8373255.1 hypothetical protein [Planctomycetota bacterium]
MSKGAVLDEAFITAAGLSEQLLTLAAPIENRHHELLQEPMFHIRSQELEETVYLERKYVFDNQVSIRTHYGRGEKVLVWLQRALRQPAYDPQAPMVELLMAREFFMLGDWREFQRFRQFVKSQRILDAQARQWITDNHIRFREMAQSEQGIERILDALGAIAEWPDFDGQDQSESRSTLEAIAKTYSRSLAPVRASPLLAPALLRRPPDTRFNIFRLLSFVEDPDSGPVSFLQFLADLGRSIGDPRVVQATTGLRSSRDISRAFAVLRTALLARRLGESS